VSRAGLLRPEAEQCGHAAGQHGQGPTPAPVRWCCVVHGRVLLIFLRGDSDHRAPSRAGKRLRLEVVAGGEGPDVHRVVHHAAPSPKGEMLGVDLVARDADGAEAAREALRHLQRPAEEQMCVGQPADRVALDLLDGETTLCGRDDEVDAQPRLAGGDRLDLVQIEGIRLRVRGVIEIDAPAGEAGGLAEPTQERGHAAAGGDPDLSRPAERVVEQAVGAADACRCPRFQPCVQRPCIVAQRPDGEAQAAVSPDPGDASGVPLPDVGTPEADEEKLCSRRGAGLRRLLGCRASRESGCSPPHGCW